MFRIAQTGISDLLVNLCSLMREVYAFCVKSIPDIESSRRVDTPSIFYLLLDPILRKTMPCSGMLTIAMKSKIKGFSMVSFDFDGFSR